MKQFMCCIALIALFFVAGCEKKDDGSAGMMSPEEIGQTAEQVAEQTQQAVTAFKVKAEDVMADLDQSVEQVKQKAASLEKNQLQPYVDQYRNLISEKKDEIAALADQIKQTPMAEMLSEKTQALKDRMVQYSDELAALQERLAVYLNRLTTSGDNSESE